ncbi:MAG: DNA-protecting protein DprA [Erysipelotrichaceae bacterium]|nr:DNA-protecting protein DprA [Erysipelotrichaceae bacterium]
MIDARDLLAYLSIKYEGDYDLLINAIRKKEIVDKNEVKAVVHNINCKYLTIVDKNYPEAFRNMYRPPLVIFYYGDISLIEEQNIIAVVGTRKPSDYGKKHTRIITSELTEAGYVIVSGMAKGIDTLAHETCLNKNGKTVAVLGSGINNPYPKRNALLYQSIINNGGLILSEYPDKVEPKKENFPFRNRIVAALVRGILVTEAHAKSGTLITVGYGLMLGRDIYCVPHEIGTSSTCNRLIKEGAMLIEDAEDIMKSLEINY